MRINAVIGSILLLGLGACSQPLVEPKASPPNIVMVYLDDLGDDLTGFPGENRRPAGRIVN